MSMAGQHLNRATIGPNTDIRQAIVALAESVVRREEQCLSDAQSDLQNWRTQRVTRQTVSGSVKVARRAVFKAEARVKAARDLHMIAVAHAERRVYIFQNAPQEPGAANPGAAWHRVGQESSGQNQVVSDESDDDQNQATVPYGNCACRRYATTPEMGGFSVYGHHPGCTLPLPCIDADTRLYWPSWVAGLAIVPEIISDDAMADVDATL